MYSKLSFSNHTVPPCVTTENPAFKVGGPCVQMIIIGASLFLIVYANYLIMFLFIHTKIVDKHVICNLALSLIIRLYYVLQFIWKQLTIMYTKAVMFIVVYSMQVKHLTEYIGKTIQDFNREESVYHQFS